MANTDIYPYGQNQEMPEGYPISTSLDENNAQKPAASSLTYQLNQMIQGEYRVAETRTLTLTASGTSKQALYPLYKGSLVHFKVTLGTSVAGKTYLIAKVDSSSTGQKVLLTIDAGETTAEADVEVDKNYNFITLYNGDTSLASASIAVEVTHKTIITGLDSIANPVQVVYDSSYKTWVGSIIRIPVKKGNVLWFCGYGSAPASIVTFRTSYAGTNLDSWGNASGQTADVNEGFITFEEDGFIWLHSFCDNFTPSFILYANEKLKNEIVVAANNTPEGVKQQADYVCSGTNDEVLLNLLIEAGIRLGRIIKLLRGDYYLDAPTKQYNASNDTFLIVDTSPLASGDASCGCIIHGDDALHRPVLHVGNSAYEALGSSTQYSVLAVLDTSQYGGYVEFKNLQIRYPFNQKKLCAIDMQKYGGWARLHSVGCMAYTNGYNGQTITISNPPRRAIEGCIGIRFIGKGPNGTYGSEMTDCGFSGFNEGVCINTEWTVCNHVCTVFCVTGWVFGKYTSSNVHASTHPLVLICCGDERGNSPALFYNNSGLQQIEMIAFSIERDAQNCPPDAQGNKYLDTLARVQEGTGNTKEFRGSISYTAYNPHSSTTANNVDIGFWEFGHGHGMKTTDASHAQAGTTALRNTYRPNFMQRYFDISLGTNGKEIICIDESGNNGKGTWVDAMGNTV